MRPFISLLCSAVFGLSQLAACQPTASSRNTMGNYKRETFHLSAGPATVEGYPATIQLGNFVRSDGKTFPVPSGHFLEGSWGRSNIGWSVGEENQPAPERLELLWYAFAEDKFYEGDFALPQEKIYQLLKEGYWDKQENKHTTYDELLVCVLPKGGVAVWLTGGNFRFIGRFQGKESSASFQTYYPKSDRAKMVREEQIKLPAEVQARIKAGTVSAKQWDEYLLTYSWQLELNQKLTIYKYTIDYLNGERARNPVTKDWAAYAQQLLSASPKAVPKNLLLFVRDEWGKQHQVRIDAFDETETQAAFAGLHRRHPAAPLVLRVEVDKGFTKAVFSVTADGEQVPLPKVQFKLFVE